MIAYLKGNVVGRLKDRSVIVAGESIGYKVYVTEEEYLRSAVGQGAELFTVAIYREDAASLYGFSTLGERNLFETLINVRLVGPAMAMTLVSSFDLSTLLRVVETNDVATLKKVPGVGEKTAARILMELSSKIDSLSELLSGEASSSRRVGAKVAVGVDSEVVEALYSLGFDPREVKAVMARIDTDGPTEEVLKVALRELSR
ncbi:MAG: Holliday junction branch migration protein RuvA [Actinomycetota bacterium]|nr:Holliday junction branch migration protein RuvA [Actinomycetota bacterium]